MRSVLALCVLLSMSGCFDAHAPDVADAAPPPRDDGAAGDVELDAGCVPTREVSRTCDVRWARALGSWRTEWPMHGIAAAQATEDGTVIASSRTGSIRIDALDADAHGHNTVLVFDATGRARWARARTSGVLGTAPGEAWLRVPDAIGIDLERVTLAGGSTLGTIAVPGWLDDVTVSACASCARWPAT